ncbi:MAG: HAD hydrolase-like protein [Flavobacteriales bacterium]|nr:HAD hydrolase-like protein [Flavobacteriales bacterium]
MSKTLLVFDIDDTLTKTASLHIDAFIEGLKFLGVCDMDTNFGEYLHHTDSYISRVIYEKDRKQEFTQEKKNIFEDFLYSKVKQQSFAEINGASELLQQLQQKEDIAIAYATGSLLKPAILKLELINANYHPSQLVASNEIEDREGIVSRAIEQSKKMHQVESFDRIISIGDGLWDLKTAKKLGVDFIGIGEKNEASMEANGMQYHFNDLSKFRF